MNKFQARSVRQVLPTDSSFLACENIRFSSLFAAGDVSRETSPATKSEEKRMFTQASSFYTSRSTGKQ